MEDINQIKNLRKKIGITQSDLAKHAGVSQSLVAKIESGKIDPSYSNAKKIFETLNRIDKSNEKRAKDIMHKSILCCEESDEMKTAISKMRKHNISQMPVRSKGKVVGFISESVLIDRMLEGDMTDKISEIMELNPPIVPPDTPQSVVASLLKHFPLVLVEEKGELLGIITKADYLRVVYK